MAWDDKFFQLTSHEICELASAAHSMSIKKLVDGLPSELR